MKKRIKIVLFIVSFLGILFSVSVFSLFCTIPFVTWTINEMASFNPWIHHVFAAFMVWIGLCFLVLLALSLFYPSYNRFLTIVKGKGKIFFSKKTVESTVRYSFADLEGIDVLAIRAKLHAQPDKTKIFVKLSIHNTNELITLTETIQNRIETSLQSSLGISVKSINIRVITLHTDSIDEKETEANMHEG